ncbi:Retrovirus-related Pol polyprotein from transposon RE2 [Vitis vinifera]|uniref:Retrovirus-related Pol polyprotein from transposon RE2 n=1 Tax=Vitis vinifera TaxID=29760 RepID=A0A438BVL0_VITVI|nr:Retrovirus-related Pol polyprotein from transposon RE2 [Vitis vinifera]
MATKSSIFSSVISGSPMITLEKLVGSENYLSWSASMELWFMGQGYEDHLVTQEADIPKVDRVQWRKIDAQLCSVLWQSVDPKILLHLRAYKTCFKFWNQAKGLYTNDIQRLYKEEFLTVMPLTTDVGDQRTQIDKFFMVLTLIGLQPDLETVCDQILGSSSVPSLDNVFARLLRISSTQTLTLPSDNTLDSSVLVSQTNSRGGRSGNRGRGQRPHCTYCNKLGHTRDRCYQLHGQPPRTAHATKSASVTSVAQTGNASARLTHTSFLGPWILDSNTSDHISSNKDLFSSITTTSALPIVTLANGSQTVTKGIGLAHPLPSLPLTFVLYTLECSFNLISISKITRTLNCSITFSDKFVTPEYGEDDWHRTRLGHPRLSKFQKMVPPFSSLSSLACESCQLGKHTRVSFPKRLNNRAKSHFELVHTDVWGPCRTVSTLGFQFVVESKVFEVEAEERKGKIQVIISENKGGILSWVHLGPASVGLFIEGLIQCIRDGKEGRWESGWKEKGRNYSLVREVNRVGCFIRLGVTDMEKRRFSICIPKGRGEKGGWVFMVESLRNVGFWFEKKENNQEVRVTGKSYAEVVKGMECRDATRVRVEVKGEEIRSNVSRLEHCLVGKWNPRSAREEDLERLGWSVASAWGLKGKLGMARLVGIGAVEPEIWMFNREKARNEAWVRILGLPISLWVPSILRRVREACGGFLGIDSSTERKEDLEWAKEISSSLRKKQGDNRDWSGRQNGEVRGDGDTRAGLRVGQMSDAWPKAQRRDSPRPSQAQLYRGDAACLVFNLEMDFIRCREKEERRKQQPVVQSSMAECAIVEEASRYGFDSNLWDLRVAGSSLSSSIFFCRTPKGEFYDHSGEMRENLQEENMLSLAVARGSTVSGKGCWDLVEVNCAAIEVQNLEWNSVQAEP